MIGVTEILDSLGIRFALVEHPAVATCEAAAALLSGVPGSGTKNLFLRDRKGKRHLLISAREDTRVDLDATAELVGCGRLSFASAARLWEFLGVEPGSVTLLGLCHDTAHRVEVLIDERLWADDLWQMHPMRNTATVSIRRDDVVRFLAHTGHSFRVARLSGPGNEHSCAAAAEHKTGG